MQNDSNCSAVSLPCSTLKVHTITVYTGYVFFGTLVMAWWAEAYGSRYVYVCVCVCVCVSFRSSAEDLDNHCKIALTG